MTASGNRTVIVWVAGLVVAVMLVLAATTGPVGVVGSIGADSTAVQTTQGDQTPPADSPERASDDRPELDRVTGLGGWLQQLFAFGLLAAMLWISAGVLRLLVLRLVRELPDKQLVLDLDPLPDVEAGREALRHDRDQHDAALAASDVRNGIVACWVLLEETASQAGVGRQPAETATEFVVRFLHTLDVDPRPVATLASLFREARFSTHRLPDNARSRAVSALAGIHADLDRSGVT